MMEIKKVYYCICCTDPPMLCGNEWKIIKIYSYGNIGFRKKMELDAADNKEQAALRCREKGLFAKKIYTEREWERMGLAYL